MMDAKAQNLHFRLFEAQFGRKSEVTEQESFLLSAERRSNIVITGCGIGSRHHHRCTKSRKISTRV